jgi:protease II
MQHHRLFAAATEDERVAAFEPRDHEARLRLLHEQFVDLLLRQRMAVGQLADVD